MIRVKIVTEIIVLALNLLRFARSLHPKLFATFRVMLADAIAEGNPTPNVADGLPAGHHGSSLECTHPFCVAEREEMRRS